MNFLNIKILYYTYNNSSCAVIMFQAIKCRPIKRTSDKVDKSLLKRERETCRGRPSSIKKKPKKRTRSSIDSNLSERLEIHNGSLFIKVSN